MKIVAASSVRIVLTAALTSSVACAGGPRYVPPAVAAPPAFKETHEPGSPDAWKPANPADQLTRGPWWDMYSDAQLGALIERVDVSNQTVKAAEAALSQARALVKLNRADYYPKVTTAPSITRSRFSANRPSTNGAVGTSTQYALPFDFSYEADLWGRVRTAVASSVAGAQASAADLETARLSMRTELAADYFELRALDAEEHLLRDTVGAFEKTLQLTIARQKAGVASGVDVAQAQTELETTRAQATDLGIQRAQVEHAIAVLVGEPASTFTLPEVPGDWAPAVPVIPVGLPSELLERRPDIAGAERLVASANASIGNARTAFFPSLILGGSFEFEATRLSSWLMWPSRVWSLGPAIAATIFDGGARRAAVAERQAAYDGDVAAYRQTVLTSFQEVEDNLAALRILEREAQEQEAAIQAAQRSLDISMSQYRAGTADYLQVITAQSALLDNQRTAVGIVERRMVASVQLVKALGGGWRRATDPAVTESPSK